MLPPHDRTSKMKRVLVVEDHAIMREMLTLLINREPELECCGEAKSAQEALMLMPSSSPDIVLIDYSLPDMSGVDLLKKLRAIHPALRVLIISGFDDAAYIEKAAQAGADGYVIKGDPPGIFEAIYEVLQGRRYFSKPAWRKILLD